MIGVIIPVYITNQKLLDLYSKTIETLETSIAPNKYKLYNIINMDIYDKITGISNPSNSVASAWNMGIRQSQKDGNKLHLVINHDIEFLETAAANLIDFYQDNFDKYIIATALNVNPSNKLTNNPTYPDGNYRTPDFSCLVCDDRLFEKVGEFDENFKPAYFEDTDMRLRVQQSGYKMVSVKDAAINHFGSATMKLDTGIAQSLPPYYRINQQYFIDKHGGTQDELITV